MNVLPRFKTFDHTTGDLDDQDYDGTELCIQWGPFVLMIVVARRRHSQPLTPVKTGASS